MWKTPKSLVIPTTFFQQPRKNSSQLFNSFHFPTFPYNFSTKILSTFHKQMWRKKKIKHSVISSEQRESRDLRSGWQWDERLRFLDFARNDRIKRNR